MQLAFGVQPVAFIIHTKHVRLKYTFTIQNTHLCVLKSHTTHLWMHEENRTSHSHYVTFLLFSPQLSDHSNDENCLIVAQVVL